MFSDNLLKEILLTGNYITKNNLKDADEYAASRNTSFLDYLFAEDLLNKRTLGEAIAEHFDVVYLDMDNQKIDVAVTKLIPELVSRTKEIVAVGPEGNKIKVGMKNPGDIETRYMIEKKIGVSTIPCYISDDDFEKVMAVYESGMQEDMNALFEKLSHNDLTRDERDNVAIQIVDTILHYGYQNKSSDIHIEPEANRIVIRFRIDGMMHDALVLDKASAPSDLYSFILTRIKVLAKMPTDVHFATQDGKVRYTIGGENVDIRISIVPVAQGENVVMRILSAHSRQFALPDLGLSSENLKKINKAIKNPHGMILVTGPTGSGKTTTLYAVLKILNKREVHIATIEDPVEYDIEGVTQIQVNPKTDITFAKGLRSIVRQDPDIVMVGEIRDQETADISINAALTGHLVLSTLHTNDAATTLPRLLDMGMEPFLVASTINLIVAQRLVRKICPNCRASFELTAEEQTLVKSYEKLSLALKTKGYQDLKKIRVYHGGGCKVCNNTGYSGRLGIFEILEMNEQIKKLVLSHASSDEITKQAVEDGMTTLLEDGLDKMLNGVTTLDEVLRVTQG